MLLWYKDSCVSYIMRQLSQSQVILNVWKIAWEQHTHVGLITHLVG
jgi:hypothetical protein